MIFSTDYAITDPKKKTKEWMRNLITQFRMMGYLPLYDAVKARKHREIIDSEQSMENIKKMFKKPDDMEKAGFYFLRISIIEKIKNILTGEKMKAEIKAYVDAQDPSLERLKKEDRNLLKNKKKIDRAVNELKAKIGLPPEPISNEDFNGNYEDFEAMGFDSKDDGDIQSFFESFHQLDTEIDFQKIINHVFTTNAVDEYTPQFLIDALATKRQACQLFINKMTGAMTWRRLVPERVWVINGERKENQKSDIAVGYYEMITVLEFIKRAGDSFNLVNQYLDLLLGINNAGATSYVGIDMGNDIILGERQGNVCTYINMLSFKVEVGYIEFKSIDSTGFKKDQSAFGNQKLTPIGELVDNGDIKDEYETVEIYKERTYFANFLVTAGYDQIVFKGGLLYHQETEGQEDEYSNYSIKYIRAEGKTVAEVAEPWIEIANEAFTKFRALMRDAKKDGIDYNLQSLLAVAKAFNGKDATPAGVMEIWEMLKNSIDSVWSFPTDSDGNLIQIQGDLNRPRTNNFDTKFTSFKDIIDWAVQMIKNDIGINDLREGANQKTNDVYKLQKEALETASNATAYLDNMFDWIYKNTGISILAFTMDIIRFKDSLPYKYLKNVIGDEGCKRLDSLPKISPHRMDIFVSSFANYQDRIRVLADTQQAFQKGVIDYKTKILIDNTNDHRKAQKLLIINEAKAVKLLEQQEAKKQEFQIGLQKMKTDDELKKIDLKGKYEIRKAQIQSEGFIRASQINAAAKGAVEDKKMQNENNQTILEHQIEQEKKFEELS